MPFLEPPKQSTSTPASQVISLGVTPSATTALANRAPSMCTRKWNRRATSVTARSSSSEYTVPSSVACVRLSTRGLG